MSKLTLILKSLTDTKPCDRCDHEDTCVMIGRLHSRFLHPEKGGNDLAFILSMMSARQRVMVRHSLPPEVLASSLTDLVVWFQHPKNAPIIWDAIVEVVCRDR